MTDIIQLLQAEAVTIREAFVDLYESRAGASSGATSAAWQSLANRLLSHERAASRLIQSPMLAFDADRRRRLLVGGERLRHAISVLAAHRVASEAWWSAMNAVYETSRNLMRPADDAVTNMIRAALTRAERERLGREWAANTCRQG